MNKDLKNVVDLLTRIQLDLNRIEEITEKNPSIEITLEGNWGLPESVEDLAANTRATILRLKRKEVREAMEKIVAGFDKLHLLTNTDSFSLQVIEHTYPTELREFCIIEFVEIFNDWLAEINQFKGVR